MLLHVPRPVALVAEHALANFTLMLWFRVLKHVIIEPWFRDECFRAMGTLIRFRWILHVNYLVTPKAGDLSVAFVALIAHECFFSGVDDHVRTEKLSGREPLRAYIAVEP